MGGGQGGDKAMGDYKHTAGGDAMLYHAMMEKRTDMMQTMMEQMTQHDQAMAPMRRPIAADFGSNRSLYRWVSKLTKT